ncbi:uncharacterized protein N7469_003251 [Penicillium citrinum]|uniref:Uncharacterized protein n=1 Tax=Penicillium citrinum TaxID=5077 RepID=A0A9W9TUA1_PENCI|nr:uncharacterized protein N7469_003251 [Penicillium citrinum]KAJ5241660.1 hypothetical protein N7469_003251 [Penicillium citrinum]
MPPLESSHLRFLEDAANLLGEAALLGLTPDQASLCRMWEIRTRKSSKLVRVKPKREPKALSRDSATVYKCGSCNQRVVIPRKRSALRGPSKDSSRGTTTKATAPAVSSTPSPAPSTPAISSKQDLPPATDSVAAHAEKSADNLKSKKSQSSKQGGSSFLSRKKELSEHDPQADELRETALVTLEASISSCNQQMQPSLANTTQAALRSLKYDPNVAE